ncbi:MAG: histidine phosphatase family protein [bacterium]
MSSILLAGPGTSVWEEQSRLQGTRSLPLSEPGREQVREVASQVARIPLRFIYTSPSEHCRESAEILGHGRRTRIRCLDDLEEVDQGLWEGLELEELERQYGRAFRTWRHDPSKVRPPQGESMGEAYERARRLVRKLARRHGDEVVVIVAPRLMRALIQCCLRGLGPEDAWKVYQEKSDWEVVAVPDQLAGKA